ncbi:MAG: hypothetical protein AAF677_14170 [Pseudomonadota bacterium]
MATAFALIRAAMVGALLCGAVGAATTLLLHLGEDIGAVAVLARMVGAGAALAGVSLPLWLLGLVVVGLPGLWLMRRARVDGPLAAAAAGAVLAAGVPVCLATLGAGAEALRISLWLAPIGAWVGVLFRARMLAALGPAPPS